MARKLIHIVLLGLMATLTSGCWVPVQTGERIQAELLQLQRDMQRADKHIDQQGAKLEEQSARLAEQMREAADKIAEVAEALQNLNRAARMTDADMGVQIERLIKEVQELRGAVELADYRTSKIQGHFEANRAWLIESRHLRAAAADPISRAAPKRRSPSPPPPTARPKPTSRNQSRQLSLRAAATLPPPAPPPIKEKG